MSTVVANLPCGTRLWIAALCHAASTLACAMGSAEPLRSSGDAATNGEVTHGLGDAGTSAADQGNETEPGTDGSHTDAGDHQTDDSTTTAGSATEADSGTTDSGSDRSESGTTTTGSDDASEQSTGDPTFATSGESGVTASTSDADSEATSDPTATSAATTSTATSTTNTTTDDTSTTAADSESGESVGETSTMTGATNSTDLDETSGSGDVTTQDTSTSAGDDCPTGFADCDDHPDCETDLDEPEHCGSCDKRCEVSGQVAASCSQGTCTVDVELAIVADAHVSESERTRNFGTADRLLVDDFPSRYVTYVRANLPPLPTGFEVLDGSLWLACYDEGDEVRVDRIANAWNERTITWNNRPTIVGPALATELPGVGWAVFDVTVAVDAWYDGASNHGLQLQTDDNNGSDFRSREFTDESERPHIALRVRF